MFKKYVFVFVASTLLTLAGAATGIAASGSGGGGKGFCKGGGTGERNCIYDGIASSYPATSLTPAEEGDLLFMREEEKLARDVYDALFLSYGNLVFDNISDAEQNHMDAMKKLLDKYGLADPILEVGFFADPELQELYDALILFASNETQALIVGAMIEETDIVDIQHAIDAVEAEHEHIITTYESLMCGSRNHLRSFIKQLDAISVVYEPTVLVTVDENGVVDDSEFWAIAYSDMEHDCGKFNDGDDKGKGKGKGRT